MTQITIEYCSFTNLYLNGAIVLDNYDKEILLYDSIFNKCTRGYNYGGGICVYEITKNCEIKRCCGSECYTYSGKDGDYGQFIYVSVATANAKANLDSITVFKSSPSGISGAYNGGLAAFGGSYFTTQNSNFTSCYGNLGPAVIYHRTNENGIVKYSNFDSDSSSNQYWMALLFDYGKGNGMYCNFIKCIAQNVGQNKLDGQYKNCRFFKCSKYDISKLNQEGCGEGSLNVFSYPNTCDAKPYKISVCDMTNQISFAFAFHVLLSSMIPKLGTSFL